MLLKSTQYQPGQAIPIPDEKRVGKWKVTKFHGGVKREQVRAGRALRGDGGRGQAGPRARQPGARRSCHSVGGPVFSFLIG
jgi:hypothetical protein